MARPKAPRSKPAARPPRSPLVPLLVFAIVALATYWNALHVPLVWDDDTAITTNASIHDLASALVPPIETPVSGRPVVNVSLAANYAFGGLDTTGYHLFNLAVLVACALLLFGIVRRTLRRHGGFGPDAPIDAIAFASALVWMVHPLLSETVDYVTQRTESLMGLFFLLTLYAAIRARHSNTRKAVLSGPPFWTVVAIAACALGMATKESMATAPVAVVLYDLIFEFTSPAEAWASRKALYLGLAATWLELAAIMWRWPRSTVGAVAVSPLTYAFNQAQMIARYLWLSIWPKSLIVDYGLPRALHAGDVVPQAALVAVLLATTVVALLRWPAAGFLGAMVFLTLAPTSSLVPISSEVGAERRMFLPLAALTVLVVVGAARALSRWTSTAAWRAGAAVAGLAIAALAVRTVERNRDYETPLTLWQTVVDQRPNGRARFAFANELIGAGRHDEAIAQLRVAVQDFPDARAGLGTELLAKGSLEEGIQVLDAFVAANPSSPNRAPARVLLSEAHQALAQQAFAQRNAPLAADEARKSLQMDARNADAHNLLGAALASQGDLAGAIPEFQEAVRLNPKHPSAADNLARAMAIANARR